MGVYAHYPASPSDGACQTVCTHVGDPPALPNLAQGGPGKYMYMYFSWE